MNKVVRAIRIGIPIVAFAVFSLWLLQQPELFSVSTVFAVCSACLFTMTLTTAVSRFIASVAEAEASPMPTSDTSRERLTAWSVLLLFGIAVTLFEFVTVYLLSGSDADFLHSFSNLYYRSDVAHYMGIAKDWYAREGDERLRLVFLPLYPLMVRALTFTEDYFWGAFITSQLFSFLCLIAAYELFRLDMDALSAIACARILFLLPGAAFLRVPMSESLFLFLSLMAVYFARTRRFLPAGLFTALSAFTRSLGILLLGLLFIEMLFVFQDAFRKNGRTALRLLPPYAVCLLVGCCGTLAYLVINWQVSGSPLTFLTYQQENWNQRLGLFFSTAAYQSEYAMLYLRNGDLDSVLSLSIPNLLCSFGALGLLFADRKKMRISYLLWSLAYFAISIGATWLLSAPRYLAMLFPLAISLRRLCKGPSAKWGLEGALLLGQTAYLLMLAADMYVY